jgi:CheY-like chemotaxis protein
MMSREANNRQDTILVVEDSPAVRKMICAMLTQTGYQCLEAEDGTEALRLLEDVGNVRLVLTDVIMPNMDGAELARQLSRIRPELRILFMSGYVDDSVVRSLGRASHLFLPKPFTAAALMDMVRKALERPSQDIRECNGVPA